MHQTKTSHRQGMSRRTFLSISSMAIVGFVQRGSLLRLGDRLQNKSEVGYGEGTYNEGVYPARRLNFIHLPFIRKE